MVETIILGVVAAVVIIPVVAVAPSVIRQHLRRKRARHAIRNFAEAVNKMANIVVKFEEFEKRIAELSKSVLTIDAQQIADMAASMQVWHPAPPTVVHAPGDEVADAYQKRYGFVRKEALKRAWGE